MHLEPNQVSDNSPSRPTSSGYVVSGVYYPTLSALARAHSIKVTTLARRLGSPYWTLEQACGLAPPPETTFVHFGKALAVNGSEYPSMAAACAAFGVKTGVFHTRRRCGWSIEEALELVSRKKRPKQAKAPVVLNGIAYPSIQEACEAYGLKNACVRSRLAMGWTLEQAFGIAERPKPRRLTTEERSGETGTLYISGKAFVWKRTTIFPGEEAPTP